MTIRISGSISRTAGVHRGDQHALHVFQTQTLRHVRIQLGGYGSTHLDDRADFKDAGFGMPEDNYVNPRLVRRMIPRLFEHVREVCGEDVELLHDIHERLQPLDAIQQFGLQVRIDISDHLNEQTAHLGHHLGLAGILLSRGVGR